MAGRPRTKAKREAAAASRRPVDPVLKRQALQLAEEHGPAEAARRTGVRAATIRTWRARAAKPAGSARRAASPAASSSVVGESEVGGSRAERLRARAERSREAQWRAEDRADKQIGKGQSAEARNSMVSASAFADRARELESAAEAAELHEVALSEAEGEAVIGVLEAMFAVLDIALPADVAELALLGREIPPEVAEAARERVRSRLRSSVEAEVAASRAPWTPPDSLVLE